MVDLYMNVMTTIGLFVGMVAIGMIYTIFIEMWSDIRQELKYHIKKGKQK